MLLEPKTGVSGKYQEYYGIGAGLLLALFLKYHIPGDYITSLCLMNAFFFIGKFFH
jgi:hypothetical protein